MESEYDVGIANRYALFLEEGENSLTDIKKKVTKERRAKNKQEKKENAEAKKIEAVKAAEKPKKQEAKAPAEDSIQNKKDGREPKNETPKSKEKTVKDHDSTKRDRDSQDKQRNVKNGEAVLPEVESWDVEVTKMNDAAATTSAGAPPPRKTYENRKPRERKYDNNDQYPAKNYSNQRRYNKDDSAKTEVVNGDTMANGGDEWNAQETEQDPQNDYKPRGGGGGGRFRGGGRGGRNYGGSERDRDREPRGRHNDRYNKQKDDADAIKTDTWGEEKENVVENTDNQTEEAKPEGDAALNNEQKEEVKEMLTLDEWKKLRGQREKPQYNLRKAGEGEDLSQWKNMRELQKEQEKEFLENGYNNPPLKKGENDKENNGTENVQRVARKKHIDIDFHFREHATRGGRGGRNMRNPKFGGGGYKGKSDDRNGGYGGESRSFHRNRDAPQAGRGTARQHAPKIDDNRDFPTLG